MLVYQRVGAGNSNLLFPRWGVSVKFFLDGRVHQKGVYLGGGLK